MPQSRSVKPANLRDQASEEPGVWYYDIAERLGAEVACRCVKGDISTDQLVAVAVNLTESWNTLSEDSNQEPDCGSYGKYRQDVGRTC